MADLVQWLEQNNTLLIKTASLELSTDEALSRTAEDSIASFFKGVNWWAQAQEFTELHSVLDEWVRSRSMVTREEEQASLLPIIATIKRVTWQEIRQTMPIEDVVDTLIVLEDMFNDCTQYISGLESDQLLVNSRREVEEAQTVLKRIDKSKSDFIAVAAHELKTPLTLIEGYMNMMRGDIKDSDQARSVLMLNGIAGGTTRLREIIEDMIDVSLIDMKLLNLHYQPVWIHRLIDIVGYDMSNTIQQRGIALEIHKTEITDKPTYADSERLYQVFNKVISNAVKYTPDGGTISVTARDLPGFTDLQVSDSGIGIAPENLGRIFEKFSSQGDVATHSSGKVKFKGGGPGLGLAIARGIMEAHGGSIWAESPGYDEKALPGSTFHIMIPMRSAPPEDRMSELFKRSEAANP